MKKRDRFYSPNCTALAEIFKIYLFIHFFDNNKNLLNFILPGWDQRLLSVHVPLCLTGCSCFFEQRAVGF